MPLLLFCRLSIDEYERLRQKIASRKSALAETDSRWGSVDFGPYNDIAQLALEGTMLPLAWGWKPRYFCPQVAGEVSAWIYAAQ